MNVKLVRAIVLLSVVSVLPPASSAHAQTPPTGPQAPAIADFNKRVQEYVDLRDKLNEGRAALRETTDPAKISAAQDALAVRIRAARATAKHGDIFTPYIHTLFVTLLRPELKGKKGEETKEVIDDEGPAPGTVTLKVNARYPEQQPLTTVPINVLKSLPQLPDELEYRFVGKHLILRDARANVIVDFIFNMLP